MDWTQAVPLGLCLAAGAAYARGLRGAWRVRAAAFYGGIAALLVALVGPLDDLADKLFVAHMAQHVLLLTVAPPLLVIGRPWLRVWRPLPLQVRRPAARGAVRAAVAAPPVVAWLLMNGTLLGWHAPVLYDAAVRRSGVHLLEHASFLATGLLFWAIALGAPPLQTRLTEVWRIAYLTLALLPGWGLAVVLAFARSPLYPAYADLASRPAHLSALGDQQLAAGVMWVPGAIAYLVAIVVLFYRWLDPAAAPGHVAARPS
ncbi:MAG TPA: cytochrome c oxidase assembly protein [Gaiellaceae bacterium]